MNLKIKLKNKVFFRYSYTFTNLQTINIINALISYLLNYLLIHPSIKVTTTIIKYIMIESKEPPMFAITSVDS